MIKRAFRRYPDGTGFIGHISYKYTYLRELKFKIYIEGDVAQKVKETYKSFGGCELLKIDLSEFDNPNISDCVYDFLFGYSFEKLTEVAGTNRCGDPTYEYKAREISNQLVKKMSWNVFAITYYTLLSSTNSFDSNPWKVFFEILKILKSDTEMLRIVLATNGKGNSQEMCFEFWNAIYNGLSKKIVDWMQEETCYIAFSSMTIAKSVLPKEMHLQIEKDCCAFVDRIATRRIDEAFVQEYTFNALNCYTIEKYFFYKEYFASPSANAKTKQYVMKKSFALLTSAADKYAENGDVLEADALYEVALDYIQSASDADSLESRRARISSKVSAEKAAFDKAYAEMTGQLSAFEWILTIAFLGGIVSCILFGIFLIFGIFKSFSLISFIISLVVTLLSLGIGEIKLKLKARKNIKTISRDDEIKYSFIFSLIILLVFCITFPFDVIVKIFICIFLFIPLTMFLERSIILTRTIFTQSKASVLQLIFCIHVLPLVLLASVYFINNEEYLKSVPANGMFYCEVNIADDIISYSGNLGEDWRYFYRANGKNIENEDTLHIGYFEDLVLDTKYVEMDDAIPDVGEALPITIMPKEILNSSVPIQKSVHIKVIEKGGRYSGSSAEWEVTYTLQRITHYSEILGVLFFDKMQHIYTISIIFTVLWLSSPLYVIVLFIISKKREKREQEIKRIKEQERLKFRCISAKENFLNGISVLSSNIESWKTKLPKYTELLHTHILDKEENLMHLLENHDSIISKNGKVVCINEEKKPYVFCTLYGNAYHLPSCRHIKNKLKECTKIDLLSVLNALPLYPCSTCNPDTKYNWISEAKKEKKQIDELQDLYKLLNTKDLFEKIKEINARANLLR